MIRELMPAKKKIIRMPKICAKIGEGTRDKVQGTSQGTRHRKKVQETRHKVQAKAQGSRLKGGGNFWRPLTFLMQVHYMKKPYFLILIVLSLVAISCKKENHVANPQLIFKFKFDSTQARLNNIGQPSTVADGHGAQSPVFNSMSVHYIELTSNAFVALGQGSVLYKSAETTAGGSTAIDFEKSTFAGNNETFFSVPLSEVAKGDYEWLRVSLAYQNADVKFKVDTTVAGITINQDFVGTLAGFIGFNTYIKTFKVKNQSLTVNGNKKQGYWGFETVLTGGGYTYPFITSGQAPDGATTVVNPIFATSPIPQGSCVVTGSFVPGKLTITGNETNDIVIEVSFSTNKSFEWDDIVPDGRWEPSKGEQVTDMGIRGMIPTVK
jgi:hypothetical protein